MTRTRTLALVVGAVLLLLGLWFFEGRVPGAGTPGAGVTAKGSAAMAVAIDSLLEELQIIPMAGRAAPPFTLEAIDGSRFRLADLGGRPALLYFWATW